MAADDGKAEESGELNRCECFSRGLGVTVGVQRLLRIENLILRMIRGRGRVASGYRANGGGWS